MGQRGRHRALHPRFKLWVSSDQAEGVFGDGKWRLLGAIARGGSLMAAAESLGMSYRKAWGDLQKAERCLGVDLLVKHRGGVGGGRTTLTENGRRWLAAYSRFRREMEQVMAEAYDRHIGPLLAEERTHA
jgi:molybdate transport system regulatory protein